MLAGHSTDSYVIPILFLNASLGDPLLPLTIEFQDFANAISAADNCGKLLLEKWYTLDEKSQPSCYRLKSIKVEKENVASIDEELNSLLLSLVEVFTKELRDSYLTTVVEQEVNNTVLMSQELSKRCIWVQNTGLQTKADESSSATDVEMSRRLNNIQNELKVNLITAKYPEDNLIELLTLQSLNSLRSTSSKCQLCHSSNRNNFHRCLRWRYRQRSMQSSKNTRINSRSLYARSALTVDC